MSDLDIPTVYNKTLYDTLYDTKSEDRIVCGQLRNLHKQAFVYLLNQQSKVDTIKKNYDMYEKHFHNVNKLEQNEILKIMNSILKELSQAENEKIEFQRQKDIIENVYNERCRRFFDMEKRPTRINKDGKRKKKSSMKKRKN